MKRNYLMTSIFLLLITMGAKAQDVLIGVKGGLNIPKITASGNNTPMSEGYSSRLAWNSGIFAEVKLTKTFSLQVGLDYSRQGGRKDGLQAIPGSQVIDPMVDGLGGSLTQIATGLAGNPVTAPLAQQVNQFGNSLEQMAGLAPKYMYADFESIAKFNYLMLPVQAKLGWNLSATSPFRIYVSAGFFGSYLVSAERVSSGSGALYLDKNRNQFGPIMEAGIGLAMGQLDPALQTILQQYWIPSVNENVEKPMSFDNTQNITDDIHRFNFGFIGSAGLSYNFGQRHNIFIEAGGNYGFIKIQKNDINGQNRIGSGAIMLGYSYRL